MAGGILLGCNKDAIEFLESRVNEFSILAKCRSIKDLFVWTFTGVYGPKKAKCRQRLWEELSEVHNACPGAWCITGDFNIVWFHSEKTGNRFS